MNKVINLRYENKNEESNKIVTIINKKLKRWQMKTIEFQRKRKRIFEKKNRISKKTGNTRTSKAVFIYTLNEMNFWIGWESDKLDGSDYKPKSIDSSREQNKEKEENGKYTRNICRLYLFPFFVVITHVLLQTIKKFCKI